MNINFKKTIAPVILFGAVLLGAFLITHAVKWVRFNRGLAATPAVAARLAIAPGHRNFETLAPKGQLITLPFAQFKLPNKAGKAQISDAGDHITLTTPTLTLQIVLPFSESLTQPGTVGDERDTERAMLPTFLQTLFTPKADLARLGERLRAKATVTCGRHSSFFYTAKTTEGLIRIGKDPGDTRHATISLSARRQNRHTFLYISLNGEGTLDPAIETILSTFRFTQP